MRTRAAPLLWLWLAALLAAGPGTARAQRADGLDQPLLSANTCGAGGPGEVQFTLAATGDTFPHENIQAAAEAQGYDYLFERVRPFLQAADLAYTNFDGAMLEGSPHSGYPAFNYSPQLAAALRRAGIGLVSTANNHILDRGPEGLDATLDVLARNGIQQHGTVPSSAAGQPRPPYLPITLSRDGARLRVAFLSFSWGTNGIADPHSQVNLLWQSNEYGQQGGVRQSVLDAVAQARREADIVIVAAHWGYEYQFYPDATQIDGARQIAAAGADIILGAQPHTLQPVDIIDAGGRKTLVIYSLANFLASQGAFQAESFSATSAIFYVGIIRAADGRARVSGYRYLPTIHVDGDTRPAPIPAQGYDDVIAHVRAEMRDPGGARQLPPDPAALRGPVQVCPAYTLPAAPDLPIGGDFAQYLATLGGAAPRPAGDAQVVLGAPLGPPAPGLAGDCRTSTTVLLTERQRLELHPDLDWPYRVSGTLVGVAAFRRLYGDAPIARHGSADGDGIADARFRAFFAAYGGLPVFGYPISGLLRERDASGQALTVQYFERARFELAAGAPPDAPLAQQVRLAALGREYTEACAAPATLPQPAAPAATRAGPPPAPNTNLAASAPGRAWWFWPALALNLLLLLATLGWGARLWAKVRARRRAPSDGELLRELLARDTPPRE
ncbi:CapA family protein [Kouleothrix sp.]|uniref:CapA family protein n=1 Tax=Kouleothrix sp. TaxID=2779161 RepID=UPI00391BEE15